jgi:phosphoserine phosphatase RsbU/P
MLNWLKGCKNQINITPDTWACNVLWGGNRLVHKSFSIPGFHGCLLSIPFGQDQSGGDVYYITVCGHGVLSKFFILDIAGHGNMASEISKVLQEPLSRLMNELDNKSILNEINKDFLNLKKDGIFATAAAATYNNMEKSWSYAYAGHPYMLVRKNTTWHELSDAGENSIPVGILGETEFYQNKFFLDGNSWILMFSDALIEIRDSNNKIIGMKGLIKLLDSIREDDLPLFFHNLVTKLADANGGEQFKDDLTIVLLKQI